MEQIDIGDNGVVSTILKGLERDDSVAVSGSVQDGGILLDTDENEVEVDDSFSFDGFQVVRREFFAHVFEPSITLQDNKVGFNTACLRKLPEVEYVQFLVNSETKTLAIRPCQEGDSDSFMWCTNSKGKKKPRQVSGRWFFLKIADLMHWELNYRYKILGKLIQSNGQYLFVFDLSSKETYKREILEGNKAKTSRVPVFPAEWQNQFGLPFEEHQRALHVNIFEGYAVYGIKEAQSSDDSKSVDLSKRDSTESNSEIDYAGGDTNG